MTNRMILTAEGLQNLKQELDDLKKVKRRQVAERIKTAKEFGDLSENAEYHDAKQEQGFIEGRIIELEQILKTAEIADKPHDKVIGVGSTVILEKDSKQFTYHLVGSTEADPLHSKISVDAPLGQALIGKNIGDSVELKTPNGSVIYTVYSVT